MHNRARMVVASFLTKDLYLDWRAGARHFLDLLVDGDLANNNLNWQWVAGTGTDTNPHRVFNPTVQGKRFDPDGEYVRRYVPELPRCAVPPSTTPTTRSRRAYDYPDADRRPPSASMRTGPPQPASTDGYTRVTQSYWRAVSLFGDGARRTAGAGAGCGTRRRRRSTCRTPRRSSRRCPSSRAARG